MRTNFDLAEIAVLALAAAGFVYAVAVVYVALGRRLQAFTGRRLTVHTASDGTVHIGSARGHTQAEDCVCQPRVDGLPGNLWVEHRDLKAVR